MSHWEDLKQLCPRLYSRGVSFECGIGWLPLIMSLSVKIEGLLEKYEDMYRQPEGESYSEMFAVQVKEKYGTLRFYMSTETEEIDELIRDAEALSSQTCEACGEPGKMRGVQWYEVRCDNCYLKKRSL